MKKVCIVLLNWNNWPDTLECLESLYDLDYPDFQVVVCDNGSTDDSLARIRAWAQEKQSSFNPVIGAAGESETISAPATHAEFSRTEVEEGAISTSVKRLILIRNEVNLGFAGGNNVGLRYALKLPEMKYCWILNNDTLVAADALRQQVKRMSESTTAGICGATILDYHKQDRVNALGGAVYCHWLGLAWHLGRGRRWKKELSHRRVEKKMDYVVGASMFVSREFLQQAGLMEESYFLFYEELDWALRAREHFSLVWAPAARVYHKVGGSIGTSSHPGRKSWATDYYTLRNRIRFTQNHYPYALPTVYLGLISAIALRLLFGQWRRAVMIGRLMLNPKLTYEDCCPG